MALVAKTNIELDELLQKRPTAVIYSPEPVEEQPVQNPTQIMERERMTTRQLPNGKMNAIKLIELGSYAAISHGTWQTEKPNL